MMTGTKVFIIDPQGADLLGSEGAQAHLLPSGTEERQRVVNNLIGASRRGLREIFGDDTVEFGKVMSFFFG